jgi:hypothetical protein
MRVNSLKQRQHQSERYHELRGPLMLRMVGVVVMDVGVGIFWSYNCQFGSEFHNSSVKAIALWGFSIFCFHCSILTKDLPNMLCYKSYRAAATSKIESISYFSLEQSWNRICGKFSSNQSKTSCFVHASKLREVNVRGVPKRTRLTNPENASSSTNELWVTNFENYHLTNEPWLVDYENHHSHQQTRSRNLKIFQISPTPRKCSRFHQWTLRKEPSLLDM